MYGWKTTAASLKTGLTRTQLPILPVSGASCFTAQGMTADWALVHLEPGDQLKSIHGWWYQAYVALSRPRHHSRLGHHGKVPPELRHLLALGPAPHIVAELARLRALAIATRKKVNAAARVMGWPTPGAQLAQWRKDNGIAEVEGWAAGYDAADFKPLPPTGRRRRASPPAAAALRRRTGSGADAPPQ